MDTKRIEISLGIEVEDAADLGRIIADLIEHAEGDSAVRAAWCRFSDSLDESPPATRED